MQSAALLDSMVGAKEAQGGSVFAVKEINNGTAAVVGEEYGDKKIGFSLSFEGISKYRQTAAIYFNWKYGRRTALSMRELSG